MLYLRAPDGHIFDTTIAPPPQPALSPDLVLMPEVAATPSAPFRQELPDPPASPPVPPRVFREPHAVQIPRHSKGVTSVAFSPDGRRLATASHDEEVRIWDANSGQQLATASHDRVVRAVVFNTDGCWPADDKTARIWALRGDE